MDMAGPRILLATNSERGQCGVFLATARALLRADHHVDLHFASFANLQKDVEAISDDVVRGDPAAKRITFQTIDAKTHREVVTASIVAKYGKDAPFPTPAMCRPLSITTTMEALQDVCGFLLGWEGPEFMKVLDSFNDIIESAAPDLIIVDALMTPGVTAAWNSGIPFSYLSPNSIKEAAAKAQPRRDILFKHPASVTETLLLIINNVLISSYRLFSGFRYPVPWYLWPLNVFYLFYLVYCLAREPTLSATKKYVEEKTGKPMRTFRDRGNNLPDYVKFFVSSLPELDFPVTSAPYIVPCGPIVEEGPSISDSDPQLASWLARGPTIYVNLGSLYQMTEQQAEEFARALRMVLAEVDRSRPDARKMQVLWKLKKHGEYETASAQCKVYSAFGMEMDHDRLHIVNWLDPPPISILRSGNVVCSVHHGGANSYNEAIL